MPEYPGFRTKKTYYVDEIDQIKSKLEIAEAENETLRQALTVITNYPDVRQFVGTIIHDKALRALEEGADHE